MKKFVSVLIAVGVFIFAPLAASAAEVPHASNTPTAGVPLYLYIPSLKLFTYIQGVGVTTDGKMDVPSSKTNNVGWYQYGITPGNVGTAVIDAHNTAAFKVLNQLPVGGDIYVFSSAGNWLRFSVTKEKTYVAKNTSPTVLFAPTTTRQLNLITCAGTILPNGESSQRLIVSAELAV